MNTLADALRELISCADSARDWHELKRARAALRAHDAAVAAGVCHVDGGMIECPLPAYTGEWVAIADGPHTHDDEGVIAWAHPARAARIVACVNACAGIADPGALVVAARDVAARPLPSDVGHRAACRAVRIAVRGDA